MDLNINPNQLALATEEFNRLEPTLLKKYPGQFIVIDPISREYWIATSLANAFRQATTKYPSRLTYSFKLGAPSTMKMG